MPQASVIVVGNEKGGAGKSTIAIHTATALLHAGASVAVLDLDLRQQSTSHFFANRRAWLDANGVTAPMPVEHPLSSDGAALARATDEEALARLEEAFADVSERADFVLIDTPGSDTAISRAAHGMADLIVTPMNDSFVDFDMLGVVDPVTLELKRHSLYSETVWNSRKARAVKDRKQIDWVVLRNRLAPTEARNRKRLEERIETLSRKVGFRIGPGLRDRVIYRELFPFGLTVADLSPTIRPVVMSLQHVAARQELRALMTALGLSGFSDAEQIAAE
ncbi:division plane positioning ATPase MipZ [Phenylobacterium sp.]|jgi:chromosome partitioning protein|uniref:division plane positioning ATPase MipZ n=1 Tax=Phenylobacterium sp. TaxID=1871053 RepID=UPI002E3706D4|nr:division plane positioning ATPase MipZ [Phenylobacterium sp.]HEX3364784.1 division plane positioning ATPase MipZ [Phenylobacterium sp.]